MNPTDHPHEHQPRALAWYSWDSPVGLGYALGSVCLFAALILWGIGQIA
jgi:hypothetical protein